MLLADLFEKKESAGTAWVIVHTADRLILGKRAPGVNNPNQWNFLGGHIDPGESAAQAAAREAREEVGLKISPESLKQVAKIGSATYFTYKVSGPSGMKTTSEVSKISPFRLTQLPDNLHAKTQNFFDRLENLL